MRLRMSRRQFGSWQRHHDRGRLRFVLVSGVLLWAGLSLAGWMALMSFSVSEDYFRLTFLSRPLHVIVVMAAGGAIWGLLVWEMNEFLYRATVSQGRDDDASK
jgi:uncharacterized membrane protein YqjE